MLKVARRVQVSVGMELKIVAGFGSSLPVVGSTVRAPAADPYGCVVPAKRTVNRDGSPRADLVTYRVVRHVADTRRLTAENIRDGVKPVATAIVEVV